MNSTVRHFNIPVFIPELACPFRCVYCNQYNITGNAKVPDPGKVTEIIDTHLVTLQNRQGRIEVAFFGGSFTGLEQTLQNQYLKIANHYLEKGWVHGIRLSTRPDYISEEILSNLKQYGVTAIELGAQSMDDDVLARNGRGHGPVEVENASVMIKQFGFELGLQMMTGLPHDSMEKAMSTARKIIELKADTTRIYPTLVIRDTPLAQLFKDGAYQPQTLEEAIDLCACLFDNFQKAGVKVLRMGLHPSEGFLDGSTLLAGPFHQAFGELVMTRVWRNRLNDHIGNQKGNSITIKVGQSELNAAIGHKAQNRHYLENQFKKVHFMADTTISKGAFYVDIH